MTFFILTVDEMFMYNVKEVTQNEEAQELAPDSAVPLWAAVF